VWNACRLVKGNQIANGEGLSEDTVQRTYSFLSRAETYDQGKYFDEDGGEICGSIMVLTLGGGSAMRDWAEAKFKKIEREKESKAMAKFNIDILGEISESVNSYNVVQREISNAKGKELNLVISSGGGSGHRRNGDS
jgi:hypothetical protein